MNLKHIRGINEWVSRWYGEKRNQEKKVGKEEKVGRQAKKKRQEEKVGREVR